jgi:hypothetical protein
MDLWHVSAWQRLIEAAIEKVRALPGTERDGTLT